MLQYPIADTSIIYTVCIWNRITQNLRNKFKEKTCFHLFASKALFCSFRSSVTQSDNNTVCFSGRLQPVWQAQKIIFTPLALNKSHLYRDTFIYLFILKQPRLFFLLWGTQCNASQSCQCCGHHANTFLRPGGVWHIFFILTDHRKRVCPFCMIWISQSVNPSQTPCRGRERLLVAANKH